MWMMLRIVAMNVQKAVIVPPKKVTTEKVKTSAPAMISVSTVWLNN
jgi:hypothetical protein